MIYLRHLPFGLTWTHWALILLILFLSKYIFRKSYRTTNSAHRFVFKKIADLIVKLIYDIYIWLISINNPNILICAVHWEKCSLKTNLIFESMMIKNTTFKTIKG